MSNHDQLLDSRKDPLQGAKILIVDDSLDNQTLLKFFLNQQGATLEFANDGQEGLTKAREGNFDVVLMDIQMPVMDGHEAVRALRRLGYVKPVIALTAHAMHEELENAKASGFTGYVTKPIQKTVLIDEIRKMLN